MSHCNRAHAHQGTEGQPRVGRARFLHLRKNNTSAMFMHDLGVYKMFSYAHLIVWTYLHIFIYLIYLTICTYLQPL